MRLDVDTGVVSAVVPLRRWPADWPAPGTRSPIVVSPSARTVGSGACGSLWNNPPHCWVDLASVSTGRVTRPVNDIPERPWLITDDTILARNDYPYRLVAYDARTGTKRWSVPGLMSSGYVTPDGRTLVVVQRRRAATTHYALSTHVLAIDLRTGHSRSLLSVPAAAPVPQIWTEFSTGSMVTLGDVPLVDALNGGVSTASARQLELATGNLLPNPLTIHADFASVGPPVPVPLVLPATLPYRLAGFPAPNRVRLVTTPADCAPLSTARCPAIMRAGPARRLAVDCRADGSAQHHHLASGDDARRPERRHLHLRRHPDEDVAVVPDDRCCAPTGCDFRHGRSDSLLSAVPVDRSDPGIDGRRSRSIDVRAPRRRCHRRIHRKPAGGPSTTRRSRSRRAPPWSRPCSSAIRRRRPSP